MFLKVNKSLIYNLVDLEDELMQESRFIGVSKVPNIKFYNYDEEYYIIETEEYMLSFIENEYKGEVINILDSLELESKEIKNSNETIFKVFEKNLFKSRDRVSISRLPNIAYETMKEQSETLKTHIREGLSIEKDIEYRTGKMVENDSKLFWTEEITDKGIGYLLQFRTKNLSILVKIAENNFANMFVKVRYVPSKAYLDDLIQKCKDLKFKLFGSILHNDKNGLINFYNTIINEF